MIIRQPLGLGGTVLYAPGARAAMPLLPVTAIAREVAQESSGGPPKPFIQLVLD